MKNEREKTNQLKVLLINSHPPDTGVGRYASSLLDGLEHYEGIRANMMYTYYFNSLKTSSNVKFLTKLSYSPITNMLNYFVNPIRVPKDFDVYHIVTQGLGIFARFNRPSVVTVHDIMPLEIKMATLYKNALLSELYSHFLKSSIRATKSADKIICDSHFSKRKVIELLKVSPNKITVIHLGVDRNLFYPRKNKTSLVKKLGLPLDKRIILNVSSEDFRKNVPTLIKAFYKLLRKRKDLILVRIGRKRSETTSLIQMLGIVDSVLYFEHVTEEELADFYNVADVFVSPSLYNGFTLPPLEAMACGCPVVASNSSVYPEIVGNAGFLLEPFDVEGYASIIDRIFTDNVLKQNMIRRGINRASRFTWEQYVRRTVDVYQQLTHG